MTSSSFLLQPNSVHTKVEAWNPAWRFGQPDKGTVSFDVQKECGLVFTLSNTCGYPQSGYGIVIDRRGSNAFIDASDRKMSTSYLADVTSLDTPLNTSYGLKHNVELCSSRMHHIDLAYDHGSMQVFFDGTKILDFYDTQANPGVAYVGFGTTGLFSGPGRISNLVIR